MGKIIVVSGVPGVGKTSVVTEGMKGTDFEIATFGTFMFDIAKMRGLVSNRDEMRTNIGPEEYKEIQIEAARKIKEFGKENNIILDTHCSIRRPDGFYPGLPKEVLAHLPFSAMVLIEGKKEDIRARRKVDEDTRDRDADDFLLHQEINRAFAAAYCSEVGAPLKIIINEQGKLADAGDRLRDVMRL